MRSSVTALLLVMFISISTQSQWSATDAAKALGRGINMGNTLDPDNAVGEGTWGNGPVTENHFIDYKNAGFSSVRIPITWGWHTDTLPPYSINLTWLNRIEQIIDWGLSHELIIIMNCQHESWLKDNYTAENRARFDSIWSQIATRFKDKSDSLLFEVINEPYPMTLENVDTMNTRIIQIIRKTNPTRNVLYSGYKWSNTDELILAAIPNDDHIIGYWHSYDPYPFGLVGTGTYGSDADIAATKARFDQIVTWASAHNNLPVVMSEYGFIKDCEYNSRMCAYATVADQALRHNMPFMAWEDGGNFKFYNRNEHTWSEIKDVIMHTYPESPNKMAAYNYRDTLLQISWKNRTTQNDSITVERGIDTADFSFLAKIGPADSTFADTTVCTGKAYYYRLSAILNDSIEIQSYPIRIFDSVLVRKPYSGGPATIPGTLQTEKFDKGGEGVAYHDAEFLNLGNQFRLSEGVDIYKSIRSSAYYVAHVEPGEWLEYTINVATEGDYNIAAYMGAVTAGGGFNLQFNNGATPVFTADTSGNLYTFKNVSNTFHLLAGEQIVRLNIIQTPEFSIDRIYFSPAPTSVALGDVPIQFKLSDNYPNPFNPSTVIDYQIPAKAHITLKVYDVLGREISDLVNGIKEAGHHSVTFDGSRFSSGIYFARFIAQPVDGINQPFVQVKKMILTK